MYNNITDFVEKSEDNDIEKAKRAEIGEVRSWGGQKWVKHADGWVYISPRGKHVLERPGGKREAAGEEHVQHAQKHLEGGSEKLNTSHKDTVKDGKVEEKEKVVREKTSSNKSKLPSKEQIIKKLNSFSNEQLKGIKIRGTLHGKPGVYTNLEKNVSDKNRITAYFRYDAKTPSGMGQSSSGVVLERESTEFTDPIQKWNPTTKIYEEHK